MRFIRVGSCSCRNREDEMSEIEEAMDWIKAVRFSSGHLIGRTGQKHLGFALEALKDNADRENPQPMTLEQLRERDGKPAYYTDGKRGAWCLIDAANENIVGLNFVVSFLHLKAPVIYDYPPKEAQP